MGTLYFSIFVLLLASCSGGDELESGASASLVNRSNFNEESSFARREITDAEFATAESVCRAYRAKSGRLTSNALSQSYSFSIEEIDCEGNSQTNAANFILNQDQTFLVPAGPIARYLGAFQTYNKGYLAAICLRVLAGVRGRYPYYAFPQSDTKMEEVTFLPAGGSDGNHYQVRLGTAANNEDGSRSFTINQIVSFQVNLDQNSDKYGVDNRRTLWELCSGEPRKKLIQTYQ